MKKNYRRISIGLKREREREREKNLPTIYLAFGKYVKRIEKSITQYTRYLWIIITYDSIKRESLYDVIKLHFYIKKTLLAK